MPSEDSLLARADERERRWLGRQIVKLLATLPAAQAELAGHSARLRLPALQELLRQAGMLETVMLELARERDIEGTNELPDSQGNARLALPR
jgi:hypothetical protein